MVSTVLPTSHDEAAWLWAHHDTNQQYHPEKTSTNRQRRRSPKNKDQLVMGSARTATTTSTSTTSRGTTTTTRSAQGREFQNLKTNGFRIRQVGRGMAEPLPFLGNEYPPHLLVSGVGFVTPRDGKRPLPTSPFTTATEVLTWYSGGTRLDANPEVTPELHWPIEGGQQQPQAWPPRSFHYISGSDMSGTSSPSAMSSPRLTKEDGTVGAAWSPWSPKTSAVKMLNPPMLPFMGPAPMRKWAPPRSPPVARRAMEDDMDKVEDDKPNRRKNRRRRRRRRGEDDDNEEEEEEAEDVVSEEAHLRTEGRDGGRIVAAVSSSSSSNSPTRLSPTRHRMSLGGSANALENSISVRGDSVEAEFVDADVEPQRLLGRRQRFRRPSLVFVDEVDHRPSLLEWRQANLDHGVQSLEYDTLSQISEQEAIAAHNRVLRGQAQSPSSFLSSGIELSYSNDEMDDDEVGDILTDLGPHSATQWKDRRGKSVRTIDTLPLSERQQSPLRSICFHVRRLFGSGFAFCDPKEQLREHTLDRRRATIRSNMTDGHEISLHGENLLAEEHGDHLLAEDNEVVVVHSEKDEEKEEELLLEIAEEGSVEEPQSTEKVHDTVSAPTSKETWSNVTVGREIIPRPEMVQRNISVESYDVSQDSMPFQSLDQTSPLRLRRQSSAASDVSQLTEADFDLNESASSLSMSPVRLTIQTSVSEDHSVDGSPLPPTRSSRETPTSSDGRKNAHLSRPPLIRGRTTDGTLKKMTNRSRANTGNSLMSLQSRGSMRSVSSVSSHHRRAPSAVFSEGSIALICSAKEAEATKSSNTDAPPRPTHIRNRSRSFSKTLEEVRVENREDLVVSPMPDELEDSPERPLPLGRAASDAVHDAIDSRKLRSMEKMRGGGRPPRHVVRATTVSEGRVTQDLLRKFEQTEVRTTEDEVEEEHEVFLPISLVFREEVRRRGLIGRIILEGWVAFSKGDRLLDHLATGALLKKKDYCYISMTDDDDCLHVLRRPSNGMDKFKVLSLDLARDDLIVESRRVSNRVGHATVVRDSRKDAVVCVLVATSLSSGQFQDAEHSVVVPDKMLQSCWSSTSRGFASCGQLEAALYLQFALDAALQRLWRRRRRCRS